MQSAGDRITRFVGVCRVGYGRMGMSPVAVGRHGQVTRLVEAVPNWCRMTSAAESLLIQYACMPTSSVVRHTFQLSPQVSVVA